jgi:hypothetical protein
LLHGAVSLLSYTYSALKAFQGQNPVAADVSPRTALSRVGIGRRHGVGSSSEPVRGALVRRLTSAATGFEVFSGQRILPARNRGNAGPRRSV